MSLRDSRHGRRSAASLPKLKTKKATENFPWLWIWNVFLFGLGLLVGLGLGLGFRSRFGFFGVAVVLAALLGLGLFLDGRGFHRDRGRGAFDADFQRALDVVVQIQFHFKFTGLADGVLEVDFLLVERDVELVLEFVGDHAVGYRAEQLAFLAGLDLDDANQLLERLGEFGHGVELMRFALGALLLERFELALVRLRHRDGEALREKVIARVAGGDADLVGFTAEADDVVREDDFSFCHTKIFFELLRLKNQNGTSSLSGGPSPSTGSATGAAAAAGRVER